MIDSPQLKTSPLWNDVVAFFERAPAAAGETMPADLMDGFVAAGDTSSSLAMVDRLLEAGADRVVLVPNPGGFRSTASMVDQMRLAVPIVESHASRGDL